MIPVGSYRLFWETPPSIEIYPGDSTVLMSHDHIGSFFRHVRVDGDGRLQELMISTVAPPPDALHSKHSTADLVRRGARSGQHFISYHYVC